MLCRHFLCSPACCPCLVGVTLSEPGEAFANVGFPGLSSTLRGSESLRIWF